MDYIALVLIFIGTCNCQVEFYERPRNFSIELLYYTQLETQGHVVLSPFGIWTLMTGVALGASGNSYSQIARAFRLPKKQTTLINGYKDLTSTVLRSYNNGVRLTSKNFVFLDYRFSIYPAFRGTIQNDFGAAVKALDFNDPSSVQNANSYIETFGGPEDALRADDFVGAKMLLTNVMSFKGLWRTPFNETDTRVEFFYDEEGNVVGQVNMMYQNAFVPFTFSKDLNSNVLELPYGTDGKYSMLIILPRSKTKISQVYRAFERVTLKDITKKLQDDVDAFDLSEIIVKLPRFRINTNIVMNKPLNDMGVYDIFEPDMANFQRITRNNIYVSSIIHTADIEVTESGTIASAVTTATWSDRMGPVQFIANKPFLYFIVEKTTTTVIFGGIYSRPTVY